MGDSRSSDDNLCIDQLLVKSRVLTLLVRSGHQGMTLAFNPLSQAQFILSGAEKAGLLSGVVATLIWSAYITEANQRGHKR